MRSSYQKLERTWFAIDGVDALTAVGAQKVWHDGAGVQPAE
jgi:hypothetical protein